jgi:hypothetical protein
MRFSKMAYYVAQAKNMKMYEFLEKEKARLATPRLACTTSILNAYKKVGQSGWESPTGKILIGVFKKNTKAAMTGSKAINTNLISIIAKPEILLLAYRAIKGNKGALSEAGSISQEKYDSLTAEQKEVYLNSFSFPDGLNLMDVVLTSKLLQTGLYPWGTSRRVYVPKPGDNQKKKTNHNTTVLR